MARKRVSERSTAVDRTHRGTKSRRTMCVSLPGAGREQLASEPEAFLAHLTGHWMASYLHGRRNKDCFPTSDDVRFVGFTGSYRFYLDFVHTIYISFVDFDLYVLFDILFSFST